VLNVIWFFEKNYTYYACWCFEMLYEIIIRFCKLKLLQVISLICEIIWKVIIFFKHYVFIVMHYVNKNYFSLIWFTKLSLDFANIDMRYFFQIYRKQLLLHESCVHVYARCCITLHLDNIVLFLKIYCMTLHFEDLHGYFF
jgi:hypothetical protein